MALFFFFVTIQPTAGERCGLNNNFLFFFEKKKLTVALNITEVAIIGELLRQKIGDKMVASSPRQVGRMLAFLECTRHKKNTSIQTTGLSEADLEILTMLKKRVNKILDSEKPAESTFTDVKEMYLKNTIDTCLRKLFSESENALKTGERGCDILFRKVNNDYYRFENYSEVMRGYLLGKQEFTGSL